MARILRSPNDIRHYNSSTPVREKQDSEHPPLPHLLSSLAVPQSCSLGTEAAHLGGHRAQLPLDLLLLHQPVAPPFRQVPADCGLDGDRRGRRRDRFQPHASGKGTSLRRTAEAGREKWWFMTLDLDPLTKATSYP